MSNFEKLIKIIGVLVVIVVAGVAVGWFFTGGSGSEPAPPEPAPAPDATGTVVPARPAEPAPRGLVTAALKTTPVVVVEPLNASELSTNWEDKVEEILGSTAPEAEKSKKMLDMFPLLPPKGQEEVARHLSNLVSDADYPGLGRYLTNSTLPEPVLDVLLADVLNRPNSVKLPALLGVARDPQNPKAGEAKDVLQLFLEEDHGTDWPAWQAKVDQWLKDNPD